MLKRYLHVENNLPGVLVPQDDAHALRLRREGEHLENLVAESGSVRSCECDVLECSVGQFEAHCGRPFNQGHFVRATSLEKFIF